MGKRLIISSFVLSFAAVAIAFGVFVFSISRQNGEKAETAEESQFPGSGQAKNIAGYKLDESAEGANWTPGSPKEPDFKPYFKIEEDKIAETFLSRFDALLSSSGSSVASQTDVFQGQSLPSIVQPTSFLASQGKKKVTDEEWFKVAYPEDYINSLIETEKKMHDYGFLPENEYFEFNSEKSVHNFYRRLVELGLENGSITEEEAKKLRNGINVVLPGLHKKERFLYEKSLSAFLLIRIAHAQEVYMPDCYRESNNLTGPIGTNLWAQCCNCGYYCAPYCIYRPNCGFAGSGCNIQLGCLNLMCRNPKPAIWDPATGICGCG